MHMTKYRGGDKVTSIEKRKNGRKLFDNNELKEEIRNYQNMCKKAAAEGKEKPIVPDSLGRILMIIANSLGQRYNFCNYSWKDEMISDGLIKVLTALEKFDCDAGTSAAGYVIQVLWFEYLNRIKLEHKQRTIKAAIVQSMGVDVAEFETQDINDDENYTTGIQEFSSLMEVELPKPKEKKKFNKKNKELNHEFF